MRLLHVEDDSDHDGLGDEWELANFGNLNQDGTSDFDGDGWSNLQEFHGSSAGNDYYDGEVPVSYTANSESGSSKTEKGPLVLDSESPAQVFFEKRNGLKFCWWQPGKRGQWNNRKDC